jgi:hypothetical protein
MHNNNKSETPIFQRMVDIGTNKELSATEIRYLRVTNIASILGAMFLAIWMIIAIYVTNTPIIYVSNGLMGLMFLLVLILFKK